MQDSIQTDARHRHPLVVRTRTGALIAAAMAVLVFSLVAAAPADAGHASTAVAMQDPAAAANDFVARINQLRASKGLGALSVDGELTAQATQWATTMANAGRIFHASDLSVGITANWSKLGENVGVGGDTSSLFQAFVNSPSHYANLVDPAYSRVGVGVVHAGGRMYTAHRFMGVAPAAAAPPPTAPPTTAAPPPTAPPTTAAPATTAPPTTAAPATTTTAPPPTSKLGRIERIAELIAEPPTPTST
ncbi:MAG: CAP domain-containing protein [Microthrixaceae bacterium]